jgi:predicted phage terminase large subunit-like protein
MSESDREMNANPKSGRMKYFAAADFSISEKERADYTVMIVVGMDSERFLHVVDVRRMRAGSKEIIRNLISIQSRYDPEIFTFETEKIDKAIGPFLNDAMRKNNVYLNINLITPTKSKTTRGKSIQGMMEAGSCKFDDQADWYEPFKAELMTVTPDGPKGAHDDQFDAFAYIGLTMDRFFEGFTPEELEEEEYEDELAESGDSSINYMTGY